MAKFNGDANRLMKNAEKQILPNYFLRKLKMYVILKRS